MRTWILFVFCFVALSVCEARRRSKDDIDRKYFPNLEKFHHYKHRSGRMRGKHFRMKNFDEKKFLRPVKDTVVNKLFPGMDEECKMECGHKEICLHNKATGQEKCVSHKMMKQSIRLYRNLQKKNKVVDADATAKMFEDLLFRAETIKDAYQMSKKYKKELMERHRQEMDKKHPDGKHMLHEDFKAAVAEVSSKDECLPHELHQLRQRLVSWYVMMHTESRQHHHRGKILNFHKKHGLDKMDRKKHPRNKRSYGTLDTEFHGDCTCTKSAMWEFRAQDKDQDGQLNHQELTGMEGNKREPCMKSLLQSCDTDNNGVWSQAEWCCCFADTAGPCAEKKALSNPKDWAPECDSEGYFQREQCRDGYCWCVDLNGNYIPETKNKGIAHCGKFDPNGRLIV